MSKLVWTMKSGNVHTIDAEEASDNELEEALSDILELLNESDGFMKLKGLSGEAIILAIDAIESVEVV